MKDTAEAKAGMLAALEMNLGVVTAAAKAVGIERTTHYKWMERDKDYAAKVKELNEVSLDFAESQLLKQIKSGNTAATIFYLKTQGRKRGYIERQEMVGAEDAPPAFVVQIVGQNESTDKG